MLDPLGRVRFVHRHRESGRNPGVALLAGVGRAPQVDRHVHAQCVRDRSVSFVVATQPAGNTGNESVVECAAAGLTRLLEVVERDVDQVEVHGQ